MITYILITLFAAMLAGGGILLHGLARAPIGYEDESGFHDGYAPGELGFRPAYSGPDRRRRAKGRAPETLLVTRRYIGPLRRSSDDRSPAHLVAPHLGGMA